MRLRSLYRKVDMYLKQLFQVSKTKTNREISLNTFSEAENTIKRATARKKFGNRETIENNLVVIDGKLENTIVLWIAKVLLLFSLNGQADHSERIYAFLQYIDCTGPLGGID